MGKQHGGRRDQAAAPLIIVVNWCSLRLSVIRISIGINKIKKISNFQLTSVKEINFRENARIELINFC